MRLANRCLDRLAFVDGGPRTQTKQCPRLEGRACSCAGGLRARSLARAILCTNKRALFCCRHRPVTIMSARVGQQHKQCGPRRSVENLHKNQHFLGCCRSANPAKIRQNAPHTSPLVTRPPVQFQSYCIMPAVCRFYLKGNCRYGKNCRFEHPGENKSSGFSFTKALEETETKTNFSFTKALEETTSNPTYPFVNNQQPFYSSTPYNFAGGQQQWQTGFNNSYNQTSIFNQSYQPQYGNFANFTFATSAVAPNQTYQYNSLVPDQTIRPGIDEIDMRLTGESQSCDNIQLTELELKAYQSDKFQFRLIPIRPPPRSLCF
jgi:hypothetical protein